MPRDFQSLYVLEEEECAPSCDNKCVQPIPESFGSAHPSGDKDAAIPSDSDADSFHVSFRKKDNIEEHHEFGINDSWMEEKVGHEEETEELKELRIEGGEEGEEIGKEIGEGIEIGTEGVVGEGVEVVTEEEIENGSAEVALELEDEAEEGSSLSPLKRQTVHETVIAVDANKKGKVKTSPTAANTYAAKKTVAQGIMDIALITSNANQLRYLITFGDHATQLFRFNVGLIVVSIALQIVIGVMLIFKGRADLSGKNRTAHANRINNYVVGGVFLVTIINVFVSAFAIGPSTPAPAIFVPAPANAT